MRQLKISNKITSRDSLSLNKYLADINKEPMITADEEIKLAQKIKVGDQVALNKLARANLRFVVSVAKQYQHQGIPLVDLINEGNLGLIKACKKFDETKGFKFISYAVWWIRQSIMQSIVEHSRIIKVPTNKKVIINKIVKTKNSFELEYQREPSIEELADLLEMDKSKIVDLLLANQNSVSLDAPLGNSNDDDLNLLNTIAGIKSMEPDQLLLKQSLKTETDKILSLLSQKERQVIIMYFGLKDSSPLSLEEIGLRLDLTRERVRQIKERSIVRIRKASGIDNLMNY